MIEIKARLWEILATKDQLDQEYRGLLQKLQEMAKEAKPEDTNAEPVAG